MSGVASQNHVTQYSLSTHCAVEFWLLGWRPIYTPWVQGGFDLELGI